MERKRIAWSTIAGGVLGLCLTLAGAATANAQTPAKELFGAQHTASAARPESIGFYSHGCLAGAAQLPADGAAWQAMRLSRDRRWGHPELVAYVERLATEVRRRGLWPGLLIGDLSMARGGPMPFGHSSHQIGLDADVWFQPMPGRPLSEQAREDFPFRSVLKKGGLTVDDRIWNDSYRDVLQLAASDGEVERILVHPGIKKKLCETTKGNRAWLNKVRPYYGHHEHFHVRLMCQPGSPNCESQRSTGSGDGCDKLDWWFDVALQPPPPNAKPPKPKPPLTLADLPRQCRSVLAAPARAQSGLAISSKTGRPAPSTYSSSYAAPATVPLPRFRPDR